MGQGAADALDVAGVHVHRVDESARLVDTVDAAARTAFSGYRAVAVLIGQRVIGSKRFGGEDSET
jgi:hypothetical protein